MDPGHFWSFLKPTLKVGGQTNGGSVITVQSISGSKTHAKCPETKLHSCHSAPALWQLMTELFKPLGPTKTMELASVPTLLSNVSNGANFVLEELPDSPEPWRYSQNRARHFWSGRSSSSSKHADGPIAAAGQWSITTGPRKGSRSFNNQAASPNLLRLSRASPKRAVTC